jgi:antitoxin component YwqK of YwqJK toxin-antitoxin module
LEGLEQWYPEGALAEERFYVSDKEEHKGCGRTENQNIRINFSTMNTKRGVQEWYFSGQLLSDSIDKGQEEGSEQVWFEWEVYVQIRYKGKWF